MAIKLLVSKSHDPKLNLAIEEYLTTSFKSADPILFFWQNENTIVVGRNQNTFAEVAITDAWRDNVTIIRRNTGGGTVFQDMGNVCFSVIVNNDSQTLDYQRALQPIINFLNENNIGARFSGRNDLVVDEFKISGNAQLKNKDKTLVHGTLLFNVDLAKMGKYLTVNEEKIKHQKVQSKASRVKNLVEFYRELGVELSVEDFLNQLVGYYLNLNESETIIFNDEEINLIQEIKMNKYDRWEWTFGKNSDYEVSKSAYLEGKGFIQINSIVDEGIIKKIKIFGDFLGTGGTELLEQVLQDQKLERNNLEQVISQVDIKHIFGDNFTNDDILNILFR